MRLPKTAIALMLLLGGGALAQAPERLAGHWEGEIAIPGRALGIRVDLANEAGTWTGSIDIPAQGAAGLPLIDIGIVDGADGTTVRFAMQGVPGDPTFDGKLDEDGVIRGTFAQGGARLGFHLSRDVAAGPPRPQEPQGPFPYLVEPARYTSGEVRLAGTLTIPEGPGPFPAVLLISGSGPQDRNEEVFDHKPFWVLADHLTRAGIAVLRVDDPGVGESSPHPEPPTTADFAGDAAAGVDFLRSDSRIGHIGLVGHSEGAIIGPLVASRSDEVSFLVLLAGPGVPGDQLLRKQNERLFDATGITGARRERLLTLLDRLFAALASELPEDQVRAEVTEVVRGQLEVNGIPREQQDETRVRTAVESAMSPWMRHLLAYDPRPTLEATAVPVLALNGGLDLQVDAEQNLTAIADSLERGGNDDVTIHLLPGLNHLFQQATTGLIGEYGSIEQTIAPEVLDLVRDWILEVAGQRSAKVPAKVPAEY